MSVEIPVETLNQLLTGEEHLSKDIEEQNQKLEEQFPRWMCYLCEHLNVLLYGLGSKRNLLDRFKEYLDAQDCSHLVVRGYQSTASMKKILTTLFNFFKLESRNPGLNPVEMVHQLRRQLTNDDPDIVLLIHNIDGVSLREESTQTALSLLALIPNIRIIATVDHINSLLLWDQTMLARFRWLLLQASTYRSYGTEILTGDSKILGFNRNAAGRDHSMASLDSVWSSLTKNARSVFVLFAGVCLQSSQIKESTTTTTTETGQNGQNGGISFRALYKACRAEFLVSGERALEQQLEEFRDHRLIAIRKEPDGTELFALAVDKQLIKKFLKTQGHQLQTEDEDADEEMDN